MLKYLLFHILLLICKSKAEKIRIYCDTDQIHHHAKIAVWGLVFDYQIEERPALRKMKFDDSREMSKWDNWLESETNMEKGQVEAVFDHFLASGTWSSSCYRSVGHNCLDFVYLFANAILGREVPEAEWPQCFRAMDRERAELRITEGGSNRKSCFGRGWDMATFWKYSEEKLEGVQISGMKKSGSKTDIKNRK